MNHLAVWRDIPVLVTGHTGFKGSWLALWLSRLGARVTGLALPPETTPNHWDLLGLEGVADLRGDIRDSAVVARAFEQARPQIVFHLAAQPLVRRSYRQPQETWGVNVMGTAHVLDQARQTPGVRAVLVVTTDKVYANQNWPWGYRETDGLGGHDPYSASKAACELVVDSYRKAFFHEPDAPLIASARAGNVIGGGDWSEDRLVPDLVRAVAQGRPLEIRCPRATRPWQHVLDCLNGYLALGAGLLAGRREMAEAWNFGPGSEDNLAVADVLERMGVHWPALAWRPSDQPQPHEAALLYLDSAKARARLGWRPVWGLDEALAATAQWYRACLEGGECLSGRQIAEFTQALEAVVGPQASADE